MNIFFKNKVNFLKASKISLALFLLILPWQTVYIFREVFWDETKWEYGTLNFYFFELILWFFILFGFVWLWKNNIKSFKNLKIELNQKIIPVFFISLVFLFFVISSFLASDFALAFQKIRQIIEALLFFFLLILLPIKFNFIIRWFFIGSLFPTILGIWQFILQNSFNSTLLGISEHTTWIAGSSIISGPVIGRWLRAYGSFVHPNIFGGYLFLVLFSLLLNFYKLKQNSTLLIFLSSILPIIGLFFSFSRSAWLAFLFFIIFIFILAFIKKRDNFVRALFYLSFLIVSLFFIFYPLVQVRVLGNSTNEAISINERVRGYSDAGNILKDNLFFGVGGGNYTLALKEKYPNIKPWGYQPVHNIFILFLIEFGLIGFILVLGTLYIFEKELKLKKQLNTKVILLIFPFIILGILDHYLYSFPVGLFFSSLFCAIVYRYFLDKK